MKTIQLTKGKVALIDDEDYAYLSKFKWHAKACNNGLWYAARTINYTDVNGKKKSKTVRMHRAILPVK